MKKIIFTVCLLMAAMFLTAQEVPQAINFQAIARDANSEIMANTQIMIQLTILDGAPDGTQIYREIRSLMTNNYGSFSFQIGRDPYISLGEFADIDWAGGRKFLKIDYDPTASLSFNLSLGTIEFVSVPYAFAAGSVSYIDATGANDGDVLAYNAATGRFEPVAMSGAGGGITMETDPTVPDWAKADAKPTYDYSEIENTPDLSGYLTTESQTLAEVATLDNSMNNIQIKNLADPTDNQDAVTKAYVDILITQLWEAIEALGGNASNIFTDIRDGNTYSILTIGSQTWMAENLRYEGNIPLGRNITSSTNPYRYYPNDNETYVETYGYLYNWQAAMNGEVSSSSNPSGVQGICPNGWHLPSHQEWTQLVETIEGNNVGSQLAGDSGLWQPGALTQANNFGASGFNAIPAGSNGNNPVDLGIHANFWSSTEYSNNTAQYFTIYNYSTGYSQGAPNKTFGFSVRCVRNN